VEIRDYLRIARRRWLLIAGCIVAALAVAALVTFRATPLYSSNAQLFISTPGSDSSQAYQGGLFSQQRVTSYADLATSREVAEQVLEATEVELTPSELAEKVSATAKPETVILELSVSDPSPRVAQRLAQAYARAMTEFITELERPTDDRPAPIKATIAVRASLPEAPYSPQPVRNLGLAAVLGLLLGIGAAVLREILDTTLKSADDVETVTPTPLMGHIGHDPEAPRKPLISDLSSHAPRAEAFRVLRTNLQFVDVDNAHKVFTVSSAIPQEGKTTTAVNLAIALAQAGGKTLLVDGDLRRPKVDQLLHLEHAVGLTTVLVGKIEAVDAIQQHSPSGLDVLTSGAVPPNPAELLQSHAMNELLDKLRGSYDTIIIDAPPLLPVTDAALLAARSEGALLVIRHGRTTREQLRLSIERLQAVDARAVGILMNMVPTRKGRGFDSYGYGYGYGYAPEAPDLGDRRRDRQVRASRS
jgi:receptor protein-tyrosine kinase